MKSIKIILFYILAPIFIFILATYLTISITLKGQKTTICPDIRGKSVEEAKELVKTKGLSFSILRYERRNDVPYNHITVQKPDANINTRLGRIVYVIVSEGPELIKAPGFVGKSLDEAKAVMEEKRLILDRIITVPSARVGKVIAQIPTEGTEILQDSKVTFIIGGEQTTYFLIPDTRKIDVTELAEEMEAKKIKYKINYVRNDRTSRDSGFDLSVPAKTIFNGSDELTINVY
jgi:eukaryotic-like serine/threonine-protein kinase